MTLSDIIKRYLYEYHYSYETFAKKCNLSKGYISMLVNNKNPRTAKPPIPTIKTYSNIAKGLEMTLDELFRVIDDAPVDISDGADDDESNAVVAVTPEARIVSGGMDRLPKEQREQILAVVRAMFANNPDLFKE